MLMLLLGQKQLLAISDCVRTPTNIGYSMPWFEFVMRLLDIKRAQQVRHVIMVACEMDDG